MTPDWLNALVTSAGVALVLTLRLRRQRVPPAWLAGCLISGTSLTALGLLHLLDGQGGLSDTAWTLRLVTTANLSAMTALLLGMLVDRQWRAAPEPPSDEVGHQPIP